MPLRWKRGSNPYVDNAFGVLQVGSFANAAYIAARADDLVRAARRKAGNSAQDEHAIAQASNVLSSPVSRAEEQLLVHSQVRRDVDRPRRLAGQIEQAAVLPPERELPALRDPLAIFWFTPAPTEDIAPLPPWDALQLTAIGDPEDLALDIVFDL